jgi:hypothetical protein
LSPGKIGAVLILSTGSLWSQQPGPAAPKDAIRNGGFERTVQVPNLWSGVDKDGFLAGFRGFLPALNPSGSIAETSMPVGVAVGDLNGDGLPDILSSDPLGYVRIYFNSGSKEQPKFTTGELGSPWLASGEGDPPWRPQGVQPHELLAWNRKWAERRLGVRASLADLTGSGKLDLVAGNYFGDIFIVPNGGSAQAPRFAQPTPIAKAIVPTTKDPLRRWGNVFAPVMHDWDGDNKPDLLVGEGSYSANNIHLFLNQGSAASPVFNEEKRQALALGEGRQQLTPTLADVNGDGTMDILVADREGRVTAYLRPANWKFGDTISPSGYLAKNGGLTPEEGAAFTHGSGLSTVTTGDLNGDGLFDLFFGKGANGRIVWAANKGTKDSPKFDAAADLTGEKPVPAAWQQPSQWEIDTGISRGNFFAYANCVSAEEDPNASPPEGSRALKFGFAGLPDSPTSRVSFPGTKAFRFGEYNQNHYFYDIPLAQRILDAPSRTFMMQQPVQLQAGTSYVLSMRHKGSGVVRAHVFVGWWGRKELGEAREVRGERGAVTKIHNDVHEHGNVSQAFRPGTSWSNFEEKFTVSFKDRQLKDVTMTHKATLIIAFELTAPDGFLYLDDLKLVPQG